MELNDLLQGKRIDPHEVLVLRHRPTEPDLRKALPWLAADKPELFNAYQQTQGQVLEKAMLRSKYVASFIAHGPGKALYVGVYKVNGSRPMTKAEGSVMHDNIELERLGSRIGGNRPSYLWFDLEQTNFYSEWKGKLIVAWPGLERAWWRWAYRNVIPICAILEDSALDPPIKRWDELDLSWGQLKVLPKRLQAKLSEWRGIYYIFDTSVGKGYVGSAYGEDNLLGRWFNYATTGHGGNHLLKERDPQHFRFTILELVAPNTEPDEVIQRESSWKERLHTRKPHGLNEN